MDKMSKTLPEYNSLVRWTVNDVCLWLMENGFSNFVQKVALMDQDLQELLRCVKAIERKESPSRPQGVQNIVNRPPPRQPDPPKKDYKAPPTVPTNDDSDEGSGPDDDYMWPQSDFSDSDDQPRLIEEDVYDDPYEEKEETTTRKPSRSTSHSIVDKLKFELQKRSKKEEVPSEDSDSEDYEKPSGPSSKPGPSHVHRPPPPLPTQQKTTPKPPVPAATARRAPPQPKEEEQLVYEEVEETNNTQQKPPKPQIMHRRPPVEPPPVEETQTSIPDHRAPPLPPNAKNKAKLPPPPVAVEETQDVYEIPTETSPTEQPAYLDMQKPQSKVEEQELYELPEQEEKPAPSRPLPSKPQPESAPPPPKTKHIHVPKPPGRKDPAVSRPLPTLPTPDNDSKDEEDTTGEENISSFPWYHQIERKEADRKLKEHGTTGVFLIRNSSKANQPYTLALLYESNVFNLPIRQRDDKKYAMGNPKKHEQGFDKVSQLVEFFSSHTLILSGTTSGVRCFGACHVIAYYSFDLYLYKMSFLIFIAGNRIMELFFYI
ncbi:hypothetical protein KUTeg_005540 [Tegillarca granosa]|uniref:SH2 domain-containing protein n=1 Tax=Tegillarca granosa TaxID=220873 RepID=A0ABQ9FNA0_TEGGR|nr:hypothetical protein KUTeg_005540 [Tegillarca granosa]